MATNMDFLVNYVNPDNTYAAYPANYIPVDLVYDYLIWTAGSAIVKDLMTYEPTPEELNEAAAEIDEVDPVTVALCLLMDYSHNVGGSYYTHEVKGMSENKRYVFCFSFDGATATEPRLEAWDDTDHDSNDSHVLGNGVALDSFLKGICTTDSLPGDGWAGAPIAGVDNYLFLNSGNGALSAAKDLYANLKIVIPGGYDTPAAESFIICVRYAYI